MAKHQVRARVEDRRNVYKKTGVVVGGDVHAAAVTATT